MNIIPPKLRWACRRGMLELDILLGQFLEKAYLNLKEDEQQIFTQLLACHDQELFEWLTAKKKCEDSLLQQMVEKIREHAILQFQY